MKHTIFNWEQLSEVYKSGLYKITPIEVCFEDYKLKSMTFETKKKRIKK